MNDFILELFAPHTKYHCITRYYLCAYAFLNLRSFTRGSLRLLCSILAVPRTALFWTETSVVVPGIRWSLSPSLGVLTPYWSPVGRLRLRFLHQFRLFFQALVLFSHITPLLPDVAVGLYRHIHHYCWEIPPRVHKSHEYDTWSNLE